MVTELTTLRRKLASPILGQSSALSPVALHTLLSSSSGGRCSHEGPPGSSGLRQRRCSRAATPRSASGGATVRVRGSRERAAGAGLGSQPESEQRNRTGEPAKSPRGRQGRRKRAATGWWAGVTVGRTRTTDRTRDAPTLISSCGRRARAGRRPRLISPAGNRNRHPPASAHSSPWLAVWRCRLALRQEGAHHDALLQVGQVR